MLNKTAKLKALLTPSFLFTWRYKGEGCLIYITMKKHLNKSMVEFVLDKANKFKYVDNYDIIDYQSDTENYAYALSQIPRLGHFIPCDENDVPLYDPCQKNKYCADFCQGKCQEEYYEACARVLFDGCKVLYYDKKIAYIQYSGQVFVIEFDKSRTKTYEDLVKYNLPLTESGANFFGL